METLLGSCTGGQKWHWYSIMADLEKAGVEGVVIDPIPLGPNCFSGTYQGRVFVQSWVKDTFMLVSLEGGECLELIEAFSKVVEYRPFCRYVSKRSGLLTFEWDKINPTGRFKELQDAGELQLQKIE